jgi:putative transcriptional regulator
MSAPLPLKALRLEQNLTQAELACRVGVSTRTVRAMESGQYTPSITLACRVAHELDHPVEDIFQP